MERHIDTRALDGLRGVAALHVVVGHFVQSGCVALEMTLFYLLSGYTLTLAYGGRKAIVENCWSDILIFYWNRLVRIVPSFYLSNIAAFLLSFNYKTILLRIPQVVTTLTISNSWLIPGMESFNPFNIPSWTVSTLTMMYLAFPLMLPHLKKLSDTNLARALVLLFYVQLLPVLYIYMLQLNYKQWVDLIFPNYQNTKKRRTWGQMGIFGAP